MRKNLVIILSFITLLGQAQTLVSGIDTVVTEAGYDFYPHTIQWDIIVENSRFYDTVPGGRLLNCGDDNYYPDRANNYDGTVVSGNQFIAKILDTGLHGIMMGYSKNYHIKYNYFEHVALPLISEGVSNDSADCVYDNGGIYGNIFYNTGEVKIVGIDNVGVYNNTFYSTYSGRNALGIMISSYGGYGDVSKDVKIKNNIIYIENSGQYALNIQPNNDTGLVVDYNVYWCEECIDNKPMFRLNHTDYSWDQWRALGYDKHSVILNPNFTDTLNCTPSSPLYYGTNLGSNYNYALSLTANWVVGLSPDTIQQGKEWQVGARILETESNVSGNNVKVESLRIYPNPAKDLLYISGNSKEQQVLIYNLQGEIIKTDYVSNFININSLENGMYLIKLGARTFKFFKEK